MSKVYFTKEITPESLIKIYEALGVNLTGKVGIKVSVLHKIELSSVIYENRKRHHQSV